MKKTNLRKLVSSSLSMFSWFKRKRARFNFVQEVLQFNLGSLYWVSLGVRAKKQGREEWAPSAASRCLC